MTPVNFKLTAQINAVRFRTPSKISQKGYTLIELVLIIILVAILSRFVNVNFHPMDMELASMANQLASDIRFTQSLAMTKGTRYQLVLTSTNQYQIRNASGAPVTLSLGNTTVSLGNWFTFNGTTNLPNSLIAFDGWGSPYTDIATTALTSAAVITIQATNGNTQTVTITPGTGRVTTP